MAGDLLRDLILLEINFPSSIMVGVAVMIIQHYVPTTKGDYNGLKAYYGNVMVWVCGSFALIGMLSALSMIPIKIGAFHKTRKMKMNG